MDHFLIALLAGGFGVLVASLFASTDSSRRSVSRALALGLSALGGASLAGLTAGNLGNGVVSGLGFGIAVAVVPYVVETVRLRRTHTQGPPFDGLSS